MNEAAGAPGLVLDYLAGGMTEAQIIEDFSALTETDIRACLAYTASRREAMKIAPDEIRGTRPHKTPAVP